MKNRKKLFSIFLAVLTAVSLSACGNQSDDAANDILIKIASLKGPTTMGMVKMMNDYTENYDVSIYGTADEIVTGIVKGELDIANVPANLASVLYNRTDKGISVLNINTMGVLYIVENGNTINSAADLRGKTIYTTGKGTTPEFSLRYVLSKNNIDPDSDVKIEFLSESTEVAALLSEKTDIIAMLPQPYITIATNNNSEIRTALSIMDEWEKIGDGSLVTGVTIVRNDFLEKNKSAVELFLKRFDESVKYVNENTDEAASLIGGYEIVPEGVAKKALPYCSISFITGNEMKDLVSKYLQVLYDFNPESVGGNLPDDTFYYKK